MVHRTAVAAALRDESRWGEAKRVGLSALHGQQHVAATRLLSNLEMVGAAALDAKDEATVEAFVRRHLRKTGSRRAQSILERWAECRRLFWKVGILPVSPPLTGVAHVATMESIP